MPRVERAILERQVHELDQLVAGAGHGRIVPFDQCLVSIDQRLLQDLLAAALPYETLSGQFRVRIVEATVTCEDGYALVRLRGRASLASQPESTAFVDANVYGALREFDLEPEDSVLRGRVDVIAVDMERAAVLGQRDESVKGFLRDVTALRIKLFQDVDYSFDLPIRIVRGIALPPVRTNRVRIHEATIPLQVSVTNVTALSGRLWISLRLYDEPAEQRDGHSPLAAVRAP